MKDKKIEALICACEMCKDCGFYNDCPAEYVCPPLEIITALIIEAPENNEPEEQWDDNFCNPFNICKDDEE